MTTTLQFAIPHEQRPFADDDVLVFYDGPIVFWFPVAGRRLLATALPPEAGVCPYLVAELTADQADALLANKVTLRSVYQGAKARWLMSDYGADVLTLDPITYIGESWLPGDVPLRWEPTAG